MPQEPSEGPLCPVDPETDDQFSDILVRAALAVAHEADDMPGRSWRVWIRPASAPFCRWLMWTSAVFDDAAFAEEGDAVYWPMTAFDAEPVARELMIHLPELEAWAQLDAA